MEESYCALLDLIGSGDGVTNALAGFFIAGGLTGSWFTLYSLMGNGKKLEGYVLLFKPFSCCISFVSLC